MADVLRLGFAGLGEAATLVIPEVAKLPYIQLTAAADLRASARERFRPDLERLWRLSPLRCSSSGAEAGRAGPA